MSPIELMLSAPVLLALAVFLLLLLVLVWRFHPRVAPLRAEAASLREQLAREQTLLDRAEAEQERLREALGQARVAGEKLQTTLDLERRAFEQVRGSLLDQFKALSADALKQSNESFLKLAQENLSKHQVGAQAELEQRQKAVEALVQPIRETLTQVHTHVQALEKARAQAYGTLTEQVKALQSTTGSLANALRRPEMRGRWGELQLRNVLEAAGLRAGIDFEEQATAAGGESRLRPDVVVKLPDGGNLVIDSKAPLDAFLRDAEAGGGEEARQAAMRDHLRLVKGHIAQLGSKEYWSQFSPSPEFVVMFLPGEAFFLAALEQEPRLIEQAVEQRVVPASPITLIALLRAVAYGWRQKQMEETAFEISRMGAELYNRLSVLTEHFGKLGGSLERAVKAYNDTLGSLERNVLSAARRFPELGVAPRKELAALEPVDAAVREVTAKELRGVEGGKG